MRSAYALCSIEIWQLAEASSVAAEQYCDDCVEPAFRSSRVWRHPPNFFLIRHVFIMVGHTIMVAFVMYICTLLCVQTAVAVASHAACGCSAAS